MVRRHIVSLVCRQTCLGPEHLPNGCRLFAQTPGSHHRLQRWWEGRTMLKGGTTKAITQVNDEFNGNPKIMVSGVSPLKNLSVISPRQIHANPNRNVFKTTPQGSFQPLCGGSFLCGHVGNTWCLHLPPFFRNSFPLHFFLCHSLQWSTVPPLLLRGLLGGRDPWPGVGHFACRSAITPLPVVPMPQNLVLRLPGQHHRISPRLIKHRNKLHLKSTPMPRFSNSRHPNGFCTLQRKPSIDALKKVYRMMRGKDEQKKSMGGGTDPNPPKGTGGFGSIFYPTI